MDLCQHNPGISSWRWVFTYCSKLKVKKKKKEFHLVKNAKPIHTTVKNYSVAFIWVRGHTWGFQQETGMGRELTLHDSRLKSWGWNGYNTIQDSEYLAWQPVFCKRDTKTNALRVDVVSFCGWSLERVQTPGLNPQRIDLRNFVPYSCKLSLWK